MKTSVVITVYNLEEFVNEAIDSSLGQTRPPFEVIVVNDGSTDNSDRIIRGYGDRVRYVCLPENVGGLRAGLAGLELARGDLVAFLDGDDVWESAKLERCEAPFESDPRTVMMSHQHVRVDRYGAPLDVKDDTHSNIDAILREYQEPERRTLEFKRSVLEKRGYWLGSAFMIRRDALELDVFKAWAESLPHPRHVYLDLVVAPYLILTNPEATIGLVDEVLLKYRFHGGNSCSDYSDVSRAVRSIHRGYFTTLAVYDLLHKYDSLQLARDAIVPHQLALLYYKYLEALYLGRRLEASLMASKLAASGYFSSSNPYEGSGSPEYSLARRRRASPQTQIATLSLR